MLLDYQEAWRTDRSRIKVAEKSRQIGWTWTDALDTMEQTYVGPNDCWISSRDELQAKLYIGDVQFWASYYSRGGQALGLQEITDDKGGKHSAYVQRFPNGCTANSLSSNPDAQAGKRGTRKLDEFALHKDPKLLYEIAYPGITWGGQLAIFSTHRSRQNFFNKLIEEVRDGGNPKGISLHSVTLETALDQGLLYKLQQRLPQGDPRTEMDEQDYFEFIRAGCASEESFLQEYMCIPADDASAFLPYELIDGCTYPLSEAWEKSAADLQDSQSDLFLGVDIGRKKDLTVFYLVERTGGIHFTRRIDVLQNMPFSRQEEILYRLLSLPRMRRCCIDSTGLGMQFAERAQERFGTYRVEAVRFSGPVKEELAYPVRKAFEDRSVKIPRDEALEADLRKIRKETTAAGNIRFTAESDESGHSDRFWALALALHAGKNSAPFVASSPSVSRSSHIDPLSGRNTAVLL
ncbi:MAG: terminase large subunit domain-containing protein [Verrucomicrobiales bacterium]